MLQPFGWKPDDLPEASYPWANTWVFGQHNLTGTNGPPKVLMQVGLHDDEATVESLLIDAVDGETMSALRSWVLDTMRGSGIEHVNFDETPSSPRLRYSLRKLGLFGERTFELLQL